MTSPEAPAAPVVEAEQQTAAPPPPAPAGNGRSAPDYISADGGTEVYLRKPSTETALAAPPEPKTTESESQEVDPQPQPGDGDFDEAQFEKYLKHEKAKERLEQLQNNRLGNERQKLEREAESKVRQRLEDERARETQADAEYARLARLAKEKPDVWEEMTTDGSPAYNGQVVKFVSDYEAWQKNRKQPASVDRNALRSELSAELLVDWNVKGAEAVAQTLEASIPYWDKLDPKFRAAVKEGKYDEHDAGWFGDLASKLVKAMDGYHKTSVKEAREAGKNEAMADGESSGPAIQGESLNGKSPKSPMDIIASFAEYGTKYVSREQYHAAMRERGNEV